MENNVVSLQFSHSKIGEKGKKRKVSSSSFFDILFYEKTSKNDNPTSTTLNSKKDKNKDKPSENSIKVQNMDNYMNISEAFVQTDKVKNLTLLANENHKDIKVVNNPENLSFTKTQLSDIEKTKLLSDTTLNRPQNKEGSINYIVKERKQKTEDVKSKQVDQEKISENITGKKLQNRDLLTVSATNLTAKEPKIREDIKPKLKELFENSNYEMIKRNESVNTINNAINFEVVKETVSGENTGILQNIKIQENINVNIDARQSGQNQFGLVNLIDVKTPDNYGYDQNSQNQGQNSSQNNIYSEINQNKLNLTFNYFDTKINIQSINNSMIMYLTTEQHLNPQIIQNIQKILTENGINNHNLIIRDKTKITKVYSSKVNINDNVRFDGFRISA
ncbi:MAG: hypothetical protein N2Z81_06395 [Hydrogenothermaceae bacterium]|nr:hypothetical protein [Hydrogenothermaceae bacterium]